jgi:hypothetical protein
MEKSKNATWWAIKQNSGFYKNEFGVTFLFATRKDAEEIIDLWHLYNHIKDPKPIKVRVSIKPV